MKRSWRVSSLVCLAILVLGVGAAGGRSTGSIVGWGLMVVVEPSALEDLAAVRAGDRHSLGRKSNGTVVAWGRNDYGQCAVPFEEQPMGDIYVGNARVQLGSVESEPTDFRFDGVIDEPYVRGEISEPPPDLRAYWPLDENEGYAARDFSGNDNDGTLLNGPTWVPGHTGYAVEFDGEDDLIDVEDDNSLDITRNLTIDVWIRPHVNDRLMSILGKWGLRAVKTGVTF